MVLPLFLFGMVSLIYLEEALTLYCKVQAAIQQTAGELAHYAYAYGELTGEKEPNEGLAVSAFSKAYVYAKVRKDLGGDYWRQAPIQNGAGGINLLESRILEEDNIDLIARYRVCTPYAFLGISSYPVMQRCRMHAWVGYTKNPESMGGQQEDIVYITQTGTVYHRDRECTHIQLSIQSVAEESVSGLRNTDGGKYYPCEHCKKFAGAFVYITDTGDRFHSSISCSGLKREIIAVPISQVGGRPPCLRCGMSG